MGMESVFKVSLVLDMIDKMTGKVGGVNASVDSMTQSFDTMQRAGAAMAGVGTGIVSACAGAVTATFDTQNALGEVASLGVEDLQAIESAAKSFSDTWAGTSKSDFISASYDIKSGIASLTDEGIAQFTELAALTGKATKSTTDTMGSLFATGYGIYKDYYSDMSDLEFGEMFSAGIATAVKNYKTSGTQMADAIGKLGATATNANVPMEEQLAILGQLQTTMSGSEAATKYNAFLQAAAGAGEKLGLTFTDANSQLLSTPDILETLRGKYGDTLDAIEKQELKEAFGTDEAIKYIDLLYNKTDDLKTGIVDLQGSMGDGIAVTEDMAAAINNTPEQKFEVMKQKVHNTVEELGKGLLPTVNSTMDTISAVIQKGSDWVANNQETVASIMHIVLYLGIFLIAAGALTAAIGTVGKTFGSLGGIIGTVKKALSGGGFLSALGPFSLIAAAVAGLIALFEACGGDVSQLQGIFSNAFGAASGIVSDALASISTYLPGFLQFGLALLMNIVNGILNGLPGLMASGAQMAVSLISGLTRMLPGITAAAAQTVNGFLAMIVSALPGLLSAGAGMILTVLNGIVQALPAVIQSGVQLVLSLLSGLAQNLPSLLSAGVSLIAMLLSGISQMLPNMISGGLAIIGNIISGILQAAPTLLGMIPDIFSNVVSAIMDIDWLGIGGDMIDGIKAGFMSGFQSLVDSVKGAWSKFTSWLSGGGSDDEEVMEAVTASGPGTTAPGVPSTPVTQPYNLPEADVPTVTAAAAPEVQLDASKYQIAGLEGMEAYADGIQLGGAGVQTAMEDIAGVSMDSIMASMGGIDLSGAELIGSDIMGSLGEGFSSSVAGTANAAQDAVNQAVSSIAPDTDFGGGFSLQPDTQNGISEMQSAWGSGMASIQGTVSSGMAKVQQTASSRARQAAESIRSAFANIQVTVPAPKLPHISVSYSTVGSGKATAQVPNFGVSYYAEGAVLTRPTIFGFNGGKRMVGGEAGDEAILPVSTLWGKMREVTTDVISNVSGRAAKNNNAAPRTEQGKGRGVWAKGGNTYHVSINVDMDSIESLKKLKMLLDDLEQPEGDAQVA